MTLSYLLSSFSLDHIRWSDCLDSRIVEALLLPRRMFLLEYGLRFVFPLDHRGMSLLFVFNVL